MMNTPIDGAVPHTILSFMRAALDQYGDLRPQDERERLQFLSSKLFAQKTFMDSGVEAQDPHAVIFSPKEIDELRVAYKLYKAAVENVEWNNSIDEIMDVIQNSNKCARLALAEMIAKKLSALNDAAQGEDNADGDQ